MASIQVGVVMGSSSDWETMQHAVAILREFGVAHEARVVSAHRMPDEMFAYAESAQGRGLKAIIAGAGGAAHLPGMLAAKTTVPVLGVPVAGKHLQGVDSLHSIVQMPKGIPVATFAIGNAGAANAALFAVAMLAGDNPALLKQLQDFRSRQTDAGPARKIASHSETQGGLNNEIEARQNPECSGRVPPGRRRRRNAEPDRRTKGQQNGRKRSCYQRAEDHRRPMQISRDDSDGSRGFNRFHHVTATRKTTTRPRSRQPVPPDK